MCEIFDMNNLSRKVSATSESVLPVLAIRKRKSSSIQSNNNNLLSLSNRNNLTQNNTKTMLIAEDSGFSEPFGYYFYI